MPCLVQTLEEIGSDRRHLVQLQGQAILTGRDCTRWSDVPNARPLPRWPLLSLVWRRDPEECEHHAAGTPLARGS